MAAAKSCSRSCQTQIMKLNVKSFFAMPMPTQPLGWFKKPVKSADELKGMKYRTVGLAADLFQAMGASVAQLPGGEIVPAHGARRDRRASSSTTRPRTAASAPRTWPRTT